VAELAATSENTEDNVLAIGRYARVMRDDPALVAALELIDGWQVPAYLSRKLAALVREARRDEVFAGLDTPPIGAEPADNSAFMGV
jgi:hypothetical protein